MGGPTNHDFKVTSRSDQIENCPAVEKDVDLEQDTFELDVPNLKSRGVRRTARTTTQDSLKAPPALARKFSKIDLCIDVVCVN